MLFESLLFAQGVYKNQVFNNVELIAYKNNGTNKIVLPQWLQEPAVKWYFYVMGHGGSTRLKKALSMYLYWPKLKDMVENHVQTCSFHGTDGSLRGGKCP